MPRPAVDFDTTTVRFDNVACNRKPEAAARNRPRWRGAEAGVEDPFEILTVDAPTAIDDLEHYERRQMAECFERPDTNYMRGAVLDCVVKKVVEDAPDGVQIGRNSRKGGMHFQRESEPLVGMKLLVHFDGVGEQIPKVKWYVFVAALETVACEPRQTRHLFVDDAVEGSAVGVVGLHFAEQAIVEANGTERRLHVVGELCDAHPAVVRGVLVAKGGV